MSQLYLSNRNSDCETRQKDKS